MMVLPPTGLRYCINGVVLDFEKAKEAEEKYNKGENKPGILIIKDHRIHKYYLTVHRAAYQKYFL